MIADDVKHSGVHNALKRFYQNYKNKLNRVYLDKNIENYVNVLINKYINSNKNNFYNPNTMFAFQKNK